jgi:hypothetical protein
VKQAQQAIEVAHLVKGEVVSVRALSVAAERRAAGAAGAVVAAMTVAGALVVGAGLAAGNRIVHVPSFAALWGALGIALAVVAIGRARWRAGRYTVGIDIDDDAYAPLGIALVRRTPAGYALALAPGMAGVVETSHGARSVEALTREGVAYVPLGDGVRAEIAMAATTFVVRARAEQGTFAPLPRGFWRPFARRALLPIQVAAVVALIRTVPEGALLGDTDMKSAIPATATPWEVEKLLRVEAQGQAPTLHACFDAMPLACQRPGYVGVGLDLSRQGEIRSSWIARSTYGRDCPVEACMSNVIATWYFEPLPEAMRIVLPVQVLRTERPLPMHAALEPAPGARATTGWP